MKAVFAGGAFNGMQIEVSEFNERVNVIGYTKDYSHLREQGIVCPREELDNQPIVYGYLSPMWDGDGLRYETQDVYDMYFD